MTALLRFLTDKRTTFLAVFAGIALLFMDATFLSMLHGVGVPASWTAFIAKAVQLVTYVLAALGYSPLKRPPAPPPAPPTAGSE